MQKTWFLSLFVVLLWTAPAGAAPYLATSEAPSRRATEVYIGMLIGGSDIGDVQGMGVGLEINAGRRFGALTLLGQFDYLGVGESAATQEVERNGSLARLGLLARYSVLEMGERDGPVGLDFWIEAGGGRQRVAWDRGGTLTRNDAALGFGFQFDIRLDERTARPRYLGPFFAIRANLARAPEPEHAPVPACGGPCDTPTIPSRADMSLFFHAGMHWGR